jgi:dephospho-CoA kinase
MLIAVVGFSGAGKTTAVEHLQMRGVGQVVYVGEYIQAEVKARGLALTPDNERLVREAARNEHGLDVFARRAVDDLRNRTASGAILLDAICVKEEGDFYKNVLGSSVVILGIDASFEVRAKRLANRETRPLTADQLQKRDQFERENLRLEEVLATADHRMANEDSLEAFKLTLNNLAAQW